MSIPAAILILSSASSPAPADLTPMSLGSFPRIDNLGDSPYDWSRQQRWHQSEGSALRLAQTAACDTVTGYTRNGADTVPDCRFD
jgi:hypothetical protein